jgi:hypothetical protein
VPILSAVDVRPSAERGVFENERGLCRPGSDSCLLTRHECQALGADCGSKDRLHLRLQVAHPPRVAVLAHATGLVVDDLPGSPAHLLLAILVGQAGTDVEDRGQCLKRPARDNVLQAQVIGPAKDACSGDDVGTLGNDVR